MLTTDAIADMLTRIRNALRVKHNDVTVPVSKEKKEIARILLEEGYINKSVIQGLKRISKPGLRVYAQADKIPQVISGLGIAIISTNKGIMVDRVARQMNVGGEVLAFVW